MIAHVAFYAPMKPPHHPTPSGDRRMARLLIKALRRAGYTVELASAFRSRNRHGGRDVQTALESRATVERGRVLDKLSRRPPAAWITYHCYYKAPDLIGPWVSAALDIPYMLVEASYAPKQARGPWKRGQALAWIGMACADAILQPNPGDSAGVSGALVHPVRQVPLPPFVDQAVLDDETRNPRCTRQALADRLDLDPDLPWLIATAMMRLGAKLKSYQVLAEALQGLDGNRFALLVLGDGAASAQVEQGFAGLPNIRYLRVQDKIAGYHAACDLFVWPAIDEAFGLAALEAQAVGLPAVLGDRPGVRGMVRDGETALLTPEGDAEMFRAAVSEMLSDAPRRTAMGQAAREHVQARHGLESAAALLRSELAALGVR